MIITCLVASVVNVPPFGHEADTVQPLSDGRPQIVSEATGCSQCLAALPGSELWPRLPAMLAEQRALLTDNQVEEAVRTQREIVHLQCHNHCQRYYLAELLLDAGGVEKAISWLNKRYDRKVNDLESRRTTKGNPLFPLASHRAYLSSSLAKKIAARKLLF